MQTPIYPGTESEKPCSIRAIMCTNHAPVARTFIIMHKTITQLTAIFIYFAVDNFAAKDFDATAAYRDFVNRTDDLTEENRRDSYLLNINIML